MGHTPHENPNNEKLWLPKDVLLDNAYICGDCDVPLVVMEQRLKVKGAGRRFWVICPNCREGFCVISQAIKEGLKAELQNGATCFSKPRKVRRSEFRKTRPKE